MQREVIQVKELQKSYKKLHVLNGVAFAVDNVASLSLSLVRKHAY